MTIKKSKPYALGLKIIRDLGKPLVIFLLSLVIASIIGLIILQCSGNLGKETFSREIGIAFLQIISVGVIGTILSLLLSRYQHNQEQAVQKQEINRISEENKNQTRKDILRQLNEIYSGTKGIRRLLRAKGFEDSYKEAIKTHDALINLAAYDHALENINSFQLKLEIILKEIETNKSIFVNHSEISEYVDKMQKYLNLMVSEYEEERYCGMGKHNSLTTIKLKNIIKMLDHAEDGNPFEDDFIIPYKKAIDLVRKELIGTNTDTEQNKLIVRRFFEEACNKREWQIIPEIFASEVSFNGKKGDSSEVIKYLEAIKHAFTDPEVIIEKQVAERDLVSTMRTWTGVQINEYDNTPPTHKQMTWTETSIVRLENGKIVEDWVVRSGLTDAEDDKTKTS